MTVDSSTSKVHIERHAMLRYPALGALDCPKNAFKSTAQTMIHEYLNRGPALSIPIILS